MTEGKIELELVYLAVRKTRLGRLATHLKEWGVDTRRVSNLSFIGGNVLRAAVFGVYKRELLETTSRMGWQRVADFDPRSENTLRREKRRRA
jgi:hypothetical protein